MKLFSNCFRNGGVVCESWTSFEVIFDVFAFLTDMFRFEVLEGQPFPGW